MTTEQLFQKVLRSLEKGLCFPAIRILREGGVKVSTEVKGDQFLDVEGELSYRDVATFVIRDTRYKWSKLVGSASNWAEDSIAVAACFDHDRDTAQRVFAEYVTIVEGEEPKPKPKPKPEEPKPKRTSNEVLFRKIRKMLKRGWDADALDELEAEGIWLADPRAFSADGRESTLDVNYFVHGDTRFTFLRWLCKNINNAKPDATVIATCFAHDFDTAARVFRKYVSAEPVSAEPVSAEPVSAEPVSAEPVSAEPKQEAIRAQIVAARDMLTAALDLLQSEGD